MSVAQPLPKHCVDVQSVYSHVPGVTLIIPYPIHARLCRGGYPTLYPYVRISGCVYASSHHDITELGSLFDKAITWLCALSRSRANSLNSLHIELMISNDSNVDLTGKQFMKPNSHLHGNDDSSSNDTLLYFPGLSSRANHIGSFQTGSPAGDKTFTQHPVNKHNENDTDRQALLGASGASPC